MTPKKNSDLAVLQWCLCVCVCVHIVFLNGCVVLWFRRFGRELCVLWSVLLCGCKVASVGGVRLRVCRLGSAGERSVDLETQKEGKESTPKGREAEVTSTVRERSHGNNARLLS